MVYLWLKILVSVAFAAASIWYIFIGREIGLVESIRVKKLFTICAVYLVIRLAGLGVIHEIIGLKIPSDISGYYKHSKYILEGLIPNKDFSTPYSIGFTYLLSGPIKVYNHPLSIVVTFQVAEVLGLFLFLKSIRKFSGRKKVVDIFVLYALNPVIVVNLWLGGQDESLLILVLGVACALTWIRFWPTVATALVSLFAITKVFSAWILFPAFLTRDNKTRLATIGIAFALLVGLWTVGIDPLQLEFQRSASGGRAHDLSTMITNGNIWYVLKYYFPVVEWSNWAKWTAGISLASAAAFVWWLRPLDMCAADMKILYITFSSVVITLTYQVTYAMTFPMYLGPIIPSLLFISYPNKYEISVISAWCGLWAFNGTLGYKVNEFFEYFGGKIQILDLVIQSLIWIYSLSLLVFLVVKNIDSNKVSLSRT